MSATNTFHLDADDRRQIENRISDITRPNPRSWAMNRLIELTARTALPPEAKGPMREPLNADVDEYKRRNKQMRKAKKAQQKAERLQAFSKSWSIRGRRY